MLMASPVLAQASWSKTCTSLLQLQRLGYQHLWLSTADDAAKYMMPKSRTQR